MPHSKMTEYFEAGFIGVWLWFVLINKKLTVGDERGEADDIQSVITNQTYGHNGFYTSSSDYR